MIVKERGEGCVGSNERTGGVGVGDAGAAGGGGIDK